MSAPVLLLDGASMWFRSFFGVPSSITAPDGRPVNAVRGFIDSVATLITRERPHRLVVCLDLDWRPQFRVDAIPSYKAHRVAEETYSGEPDLEEVPDELSPQVEMIMELLDAFGIATAGAPGFDHTFLIRALQQDPGLDLDTVVRKGKNEDNQDTFLVQAGGGNWVRAVHSATFRSGSSSPVWLAVCLRA